jgi:hypothetical protein
MRLVRLIPSQIVPVTPTALERRVGLAADQGTLFPQFQLVVILLIIVTRHSSNMDIRPASLVLCCIACFFSYVFPALQALVQAKISASCNRLVS